MIRDFESKDENCVSRIGRLLGDSFDIHKLDKNEKIVVYEDDGEIVGFMVFSRLYEVCELLYIAVLESYRNRGIGSKLISHICTEDIGKIMLEVRKSNISAVNLYEKNGFKKIREIKNYYDGKEDAIAMEKICTKKDIYILGVETSCDETSISIVKNGCEDIYTSTRTQIDVHSLFGGVVPEIASRMHTESITLVLDDVLKNSGISWDEIDAIAVTYAPGLMGCLLVGLEFAKALSLIHDKPLIAVNHIAGHIYANNLVEKISFPSLGLVVSGGHTEIVLIKDDYKFEVLGTTLDDAIGECYDKVARILGLKYPGGPNVERYALEGKHTYDLPIPMNDDSLNFSYSGLKSYLVNLVHNEYQRKNKINEYDLARSFQDVAIDQLVRKTRLAIKKYGIKRLIVAGGVSANRFLKSELESMCLEESVHLSVPPIKYCTDNATMVAAAAYPLYEQKKFASFDLNAKSQEPIFDKKD